MNVAPPTRVHVDIAEVTLRLAVMYVLERAGFPRATGASTADIEVVSGFPQLRGDGTRRVLLIEPTPAACRAAVEAVVDGRAATVVCADEPDLVASAVVAVRDGWAALPARVLETSRHGPALSERAAETLALVLAGRTNRQIARRLYQSESTVKREIAALMCAFGVSSRVGLVSRAASLGYGRGGSTLLTERSVSF